MARFIPKQFAENSTTSVVFGSFQEQGGNVGDGTISSDPATLQGGTAWPLGWSAATDNFFQIPRGEEMEGLERVLSAAIIQQFKDGLTFWQSEMPVIQYQTIVQYQTGNDHPKLYINITGTSTSTPPDSDTTNWFMFCDTGASLANVDLSNLTATGESHFADPALTNSPYTTNRILEIPQDIKLELNNGTLTLKAGSKVYVPNGFEQDGTTPKFDELTVSSDLSIAGGSYLLQVFIIPSYDLSSYHRMTPSYFASGASNPGSGYYFWYDTSTNKIRYSSSANGTFDTNTRPFPIGLFTQGNGSITSIDQVFNGFGYVGSTVFALPMKGESTTAINQNGTVTKTIWESTTVQIANVSASGEYSMSSAGILTAGFNEVGYTKLADVTYYDSRIQNVNFYDIGFVANINASNFSKAGRSYLSGLGMPDTANAQFVSNSFASGTKFTAPNNGWYCCRALSTTTNSNMTLFITAINSSDVVVPPYNGGAFPAITASGTARQVLLPVYVGQRIQVQYVNADIAGDAFCGLWFIPAKGEN